MPATIHDRAKHILAKNPEMDKSKAFAIATQQMHAIDKTPKGYGTSKGKATAKAKYPNKKVYVKTPNPGNLKTPKLASAQGLTFSKFAAALRESAARIEAPQEDLLKRASAISKPVATSAREEVRKVAFLAQHENELHDLERHRRGLGGAALGGATGAAVGRYAFNRPYLGLAAGALLGGAGGLDRAKSDRLKDVVRTERAEAKEQAKLEKKELSKVAFKSGAAGLGGLISGYYPGKNVAGETAAAMAPEGRVTRSDNIARQLAIVGVPVGGIGALILSNKYIDAGALRRVAWRNQVVRDLWVKGHVDADHVRRGAQAIQEYGVPLAASVGGSLLGGLATGVGVGAVQSLRGPLHKKKTDDESQEKNVEKLSYNTSEYGGPLSYGSFKQESQIPPYTHPPVKTAGPPSQGKEGVKTAALAFGGAGMKSLYDAAKEEFGKEKKAYDPSPLGNVHMPGMKKMTTPAMRLQQSKTVAKVDSTKPDAGKAFSTKLPTIGSVV